ncbi:MAG: type II secretion system F family protein, partial [Candidatus Omnitrophica bacterium]|nr:type II secretion system F family protein [Candidatus Omnitrophota bacterium]
DNFEEEVDVAISGLTSLLEPILIVLMGLVVGFIVISMFMPLFSLAELIE